MIAKLIRAKRVISDRGVLYLLQCGPDDLTNLFCSIPVFLGYKMGTQVGRKRTAAEDKLVRLESVLKQLERRSGEFVVFEKRMVIGDEASLSIGESYSDAFENLRDYLKKA